MVQYLVCIEVRHCTRHLVCPASLPLCDMDLLANIITFSQSEVSFDQSSLPRFDTRVIDRSEETCSQHVTSVIIYFEHGWPINYTWLMFLSWIHKPNESLTEIRNYCSRTHLSVCLSCIPAELHYFHHLFARSSTSAFAWCNWPKLSYNTKGTY